MWSLEEHGSRFCSKAWSSNFGSSIISKVTLIHIMVIFGIDWTLLSTLIENPNHRDSLKRSSINASPLMNHLPYEEIILCKTHRKHFIAKKCFELGPSLSPSLKVRSRCFIPDPICLAVNVAPSTRTSLGNRTLSGSMEWWWTIAGKSHSVDCPVVETEQSSANARPKSSKRVLMAGSVSPHTRHDWSYVIIKKST